MQIKNKFQLLLMSVTVMSLFSCSAGNNKTVSDTTTLFTADTVARVTPADSSAARNTLPVATNDTIADLIKRSLVNDLVKSDLKVLTENDRKFIYSLADINSDGKDEIFAGMKGSYFCGNAGCTVYLLNPEGKKISQFTIVDGPIAISTGKTKGWNDLIVPSRGVNYMVKFSGKGYPSNPSVQPKFSGPVRADLKKVLTDSATVYTF